MEKNNSIPIEVKIKNNLSRVAGFIKNIRKRYNEKMTDRYSPRLAALSGTILVAVAAIFILFIPVINGVADDGSLSLIMKEVGLTYRSQDMLYPTGAYFSRLYLKTVPLGDKVSFHYFLIRTAIGIDGLITGNNLFDIRFLALIYLVMYLPAVFLVIHGLILRVKLPSEATFIMVVCVLVLGDSGYLTYFNSLFPDPLWMILLMYVFGLCMAMQTRKVRIDSAALTLMFPVSIALIFSESHLAVVGMVIALYAIRQMTSEWNHFSEKTIAAVLAVTMVIGSILSWNAVATRFDENSKFNAMTAGVLLESSDPAKSLEFFGIDDRFEVLADTSVYTDFPVVLTGNDSIQNDFLSHYNTMKLAYYYLRHPAELVALVSLATGSAFSIRRDYVGNYESTSGYAQRARTPFLCMYSNFKASSIPRTLGAVAVVFVIYIVLMRRKKSEMNDEEERLLEVPFAVFLMLMGISICHSIEIILLSGSSEFERYSMVYGVCLDLMLLMFVAEILHKLGIVGESEKR